MTGNQGAAREGIESSSPLICTAYVPVALQYTPFAHQFLSGKRTFTSSGGAADGWDSARFLNLFIALAESRFRTLLSPAPVTQTVGHTNAVQGKKDAHMDYWHRIRKAMGKETIIIPGAAGAIVQEGKILLVRHNLLKKWQVPGGLQEVGESILQTIQREIQEELALDLVAGSLIGVYSHPRWTIEFPDESKLQQLTFFFMMAGEISSIHMQASEIAAYQFFAPDEIPDDTFACCKQKVADWAQFQGHVVFG